MSDSYFPDFISGMKPFVSGTSPGIRGRHLKMSFQGRSPLGRSPPPVRFSAPRAPAARTRCSLTKRRRRVKGPGLRARAAAGSGAAPGAAQGGAGAGAGAGAAVCPPHHGSARRSAGAVRAAVGRGAAESWRGREAEPRLGAARGG